jgi:hypothetical protein
MVSRRHGHHLRERAHDAIHRRLAVTNQRAAGGPSCGVNTSAPDKNPAAVKATPQGSPWTDGRYETPKGAPAADVCGRRAFLGV